MHIYLPSNRWRMVGLRTVLNHSSAAGICLLALISLAVGTAFSPVLAQSHAVNWRGEASFLASTSEDAPFWLTSNQFGVVDRNDRAAAVRLTAATSFVPAGRLKWSAGLDVVSRASSHSTLFLQQFYGELHAGHLTLRAGRKERTVGMVYEYLSLGSMLVSGNAAPLTEVSLSAHEWIGVPGTQNWVELKGFLGHGWFGGDRHVQNALSHEKQFAIRLGGDWPVHGTGRIVHFVQWGGTSPLVGRLPQSLEDYLRVVFVRPAGDSTTVLPEQTNVLGNSLGAYDFRLDVDLAALSFSIYRLFYHEDTVSLRFRNPWDGMWGVGMRFSDNPLGIRTLLWEHVFTKKQGSKPEERRGTDNIYNHYLYGTGWTHYGRSLGLPLMVTAAGIEGVVNNIVVAHHVGLSGALPLDMSYEMRLTYSRNYGAHTLIDKEPYARYETPLPAIRKDQYSAMFSLAMPLGARSEWQGRFVIAYDTGDLLPDGNLGVTVGFVRSGTKMLR